MEDIQDIGDTMHEWGPKMGDLSRLCEMLKQSDNDFKNMTRDAERIQKQASSNKKIDLSNFVTDIKNQTAKMSEAWSGAKTLAKTDPDAALQKLEDDFYGEMDNFQSIREAMDTVLNISKGLKDAKNEISRYTKELARLKSKKIDISELEPLLADFASKANEIAAFVKVKGFSADDLVDKVQEAFDVRQELQDKFQEQGVMLNQGGPQFKSEGGFQFQIPQGFERSMGATPTATQGIGN